MSTTNIIPKLIRQQDFTATAGQTSFGPANFLMVDLADLVVLVKSATDAAFTQATIGWTANLSPVSIGFPSVIFAAGRTVGDVVRLTSRRIHERTTDVTRAGSVQTAALELELDKIAMALIDVTRDAGDAYALASQIAQAINTGVSMNGAVIAAFFNTLPTTQPVSAGQLWRNGNATDGYVICTS